MQQRLGALIVVMDYTGLDWEEFNDWYDTEHIPERLRVPGMLAAERWLSTAGDNLHVAIYELESLAVLETPAYKAIAGENLSPWSKRMFRKVKAMRRFECEQILPGGLATPRGAGGLFLVGRNVEPGAEAEFNDWYNTEHVPLIEKIDGALAVRRYRTVKGDLQYWGVYHLTAPEVFYSEAWKAAQNTERTLAVRPKTRDNWRFVGKPYIRA